MHKEKILLIEDEAAIAENVIYALETEGFAIVWEQFGLTGLEICQRGQIGLIILDVGLPDLGGFELCKKIRAYCNTPIIFLTARSDEIDRVVGLEIGADDYVTKPFSPRELAARVKAILKRTQFGTAMQLPQQWDFTIDNAKTMIAYQGVPLELTRYEFLILKTLLRRPETVFSRGQLMDLVWDEPEASYDRAVDTHIKSLRAKLKPLNGSELIKTHRGFGYSIQARGHEV